MLSECLSGWQGFMKIEIKQMLKISVFYLDKQKIFIPKKIHRKCTVYHGEFFLRPTDAVLSLNFHSINGTEGIRKGKRIRRKKYKGPFFNYVEKTR